MPIKPENRARYPHDWKAISLRVRNEAEWRCQWCDVENGGTSRAGSKVVLTVHHLNHLPEDCRRENLVALCQRCHLGADMRIHQFNRAETLAKRAREEAEAAGQLELGL